MRVLDYVRANAAAVAASARFVTIDLPAIERYARTLPLADAQSPELDPHTHYLGEADATLAYLVTLDAVNFGSGYFPHLHKRPGLSGYFTVAASLKDHWPMSVSDLQALTPRSCAQIFGQSDPDEAITELMTLFAQALNDLGQLVERRFQSSFRTLVEAANNSAERLVTILCEMPFYQDLGFYKRAQLTAADLALAKVAMLSDLQDLTIFADNLVPHVLRVDGILRYEPALLERINREELIPPGSVEEREIRGCAVHAVELIKHHRGVSAMQLDYVLWNRGQQPTYKAQPRHRTRTVFY